MNPSEARIDYVGGHVRTPAGPSKNHHQTGAFDVDDPGLQVRAAAVGYIE
jgi:hypothetical protein